MDNGMTEGPWVVESDGYYPVVRKRFRADHHMDVCGPVHGYMYSKDEKAEQAANALAISLVPEMVELLTAIRDERWNSMTQGCNAMARSQSAARALLAKLEKTNEQ